MIALLLILVLSVACNVAVWAMFREPLRVPEVVYEVPDMQFDWRGLV